MPVITNIAAYKFAALTDLKSRRDHLLAQCKAWGLKGTILLSPEGINLFVAGPSAEIESLLAELRAIPGLEDLTPKYSDSDEQPFTRMLVRLKKEIIAFGVEGIDPARRTSPKLDARTLKQWLDEGRDVTLLDTRNDYEVKLGTFKGARTLDIGHFRQFPTAIAGLPETMKEQPIVMFCTGGIRCEKAGPYMEQAGFQHIFQLEGGILKYFEECGGDHYEGECFVFDQRVGVDPALRESESAQCFVCQSPLSAAEQSDPRYVPNASCPYCFRTGAEQMARTIAQRHAAIEAFTRPLPGSVPHDGRRPVNVPAACDRFTFTDFLLGVFPHMPREEHALYVDGHDQPVDPRRIVRAGERFFRVLPGYVEPDVNPALRILHEDEAIVVLDKPAPLPMHPSGRFQRNTLQHILDHVYAPDHLRPAHRLDANTSGLVLCARTRHFARLLQPQFARGEVGKVYLAQVHGQPPQDSFRCDAPISSEPQDLGSRVVDEENGQAASTEFSVLQRLPDGTALLEARPKTGRTNQIRVHLWHLGFPICGDPAYQPDRQLGSAMTLRPEDPPLRLHAARLSFTHPLTRREVTFAAEPPAWAPA